MFMLLDLPLELLQLFRKFCSDIDYIQFLHANKLVLYPLKRKLSFFCLGIQDTIDYYFHQALPVKCLSHIENPKTQIGLSYLQDNLFDLSRCRDVASVELIAVDFLYGVGDLGSMTDFKFYQGNLVDFHYFQNLQRFECVRSSAVDVSPLKNVPFLHLEEFYNLTDVSMLGNARYLNLSGCVSIEDVSALGNVSVLILSRCFAVVDVSGLGKSNHLLDLSYCKRITDVSSLGSIEHLILYQLPLVEDISMLRNVRQLNIMDCRSVGSLEGLDKVRILTMYIEQKQRMIPKKKPKRLLPSLVRLEATKHEPQVMMMQGRRSAPPPHPVTALYAHSLRDGTMTEIKRTTSQLINSSVVTPKQSFSISLLPVVD
eukprot:gene15041-16759_t